MGMLGCGGFESARVGCGAGGVAPGTAVGADAPAAAGLSLAGMAPIAADTEGIRLAPCDGCFACRAGGPVGGQLRADYRGYARADSLSRASRSGRTRPLVIARCCAGSALPVATALLVRASSAVHAA